MAQEINESHMQGAQTVTNIANRARQLGLDPRPDDIRFILEVVGEPDPWFEQEASATLFAGRFRNFVVARCRSQGLSLSSDELDLIDAWFTGGATLARPAATRTPAAAPAVTAPSPSPGAAPAPEGGGDRWWMLGGAPRQAAAEQLSGSGAAANTGRGTSTASLGEMGGGGDEFPRIVRTRLRG
jgi:hypothetical protein